MGPKPSSLGASLPARSCLDSVSHPYGRNYRVLRTSVVFHLNNTLSAVKGLQALVSHTSRCDRYSQISEQLISQEAETARHHFLPCSVFIRSILCAYVLRTLQESSGSACSEVGESKASDWRNQAHLPNKGKSWHVHHYGANHPVFPWART